MATRSKSQRHEPEFAGPLPRPVRPTVDAHFKRFLVTVLTFVLAPLFGYFAWADQESWNALRDHGKPVQGTIAELIPNRKLRRGDSPAARIEYRAGGERHRVRMPLSPTEHLRLKVGGEKELVYLPDDPSVASTKEELAARPWSSHSPSLVFTAVFVGSLGIAGLIFTERRRNFHRALAENGLMTVAVEFEILQASRVKSLTLWTIKYAFEHQRRRYGDTVRSANSYVETLRTTGQRPTILFDPLAPSLNLPYFVVAETFEC